MKNVVIIVILAIIIALPFVFRQSETTLVDSDDPTIVVISPHNEAIRYEFGHGFARWHKEHYGTAVRVDWRNIGGTSEISRYLQGEYATSARAWWLGQGHPWPSKASADELVQSKPPADPAMKAVYDAYRAVDSPDAVTSQADLFFGGGSYDHLNAAARGFGVAPWPKDQIPPGRRVVAGDGSRIARRRVVAQQHHVRQRRQHVRHRLQH